MKNYWLDSHCHINDILFKDDIDNVLNNMVNNDVRKCMIVSCSIDDYKRALLIKNNDIEIKRSLGVYPEDTNINGTEYDLFCNYFKDVDAIGEIGLDYHFYPETKEKQQELFIRQIKVAIDLNKPIIVHARESLNDAYNILKKYKTDGVLHCYSGSAEMAKEFVKLGYYISVAGPITWKNAVEPLKVIKNVPIDRLLIETDSPYLTPVPNRGKRNEPSNVIYIGQLIAKELNIEEDELKRQLNINYCNLFR